MFTPSKNLLGIALALTLTAAYIPQSFAGRFAQKHPRRAEVVGREQNQLKKNEQADQSGKITEKQENKLNREDRAIRKQEQADAAANGGHITKAEQRDLNREENRVNRQRNKMEKRDAAAKANTSAPAPTSAQ
jgi:hypothetical protein